MEGKWLQRHVGSEEEKESGGEVKKGGGEEEEEGKEGVEEVAVKVLKKGSSAFSTIKFLREAAIMGQFSHPNVVKLHGVVTEGQPVSASPIPNPSSSPGPSPSTPGGTCGEERGRL